MSSSDSESDTHGSGSIRIKPFKSSTDYPLWAKLVLNHLAGHSLLDAVTTPELHSSTYPASGPSRIFVGKPTTTGDPTTITVGGKVTSATGREAEEELAKQDIAKLSAKAFKRNAKAYSYIFGRFHKSIIADLPSSVADPTKPNAKLLWHESISCERHTTNSIPIMCPLTTNCLPSFSTEVIDAARNYYELRHPNIQESTVALMTTQRATTSKTNVAVASLDGGRTHSSTIATAYVSRNTLYQVFFIDSAASDHMVFSFNLLVNPKRHSSTVVIGDGSELHGTHKGSFKVNDKFTLQDVLYVPDPTHATLPIPVQGGNSSSAPCSVDPILLWHNRLGHTGFSEVVRLAKLGLLDKDVLARCKSLKQSEMKDLFHVPR